MDELNKMMEDQVKIENSIKAKEIDKTAEISTGIIVGSLLAVYL